jgi:hypothetical protein
LDFFIAWEISLARSQDTPAAFSTANVRTLSSRLDRRTNVVDRPRAVQGALAGLASSA